MKKNLSKILIAALTLMSVSLPHTYATNTSTTVTPPVVLDPASLSAQGATLLDADTGQVLYSKNQDSPLYPASTTKALTALIIAEDLKLDEVVTIDKDTPFTSGSRIYVMEGETFTVEQLLYAMLLESANDAAVALAKHHSGTVEQFAVKMNQRAKELGATHSNFVNPNGLPDDKHVTTAYDLALVGKAFSKQPKLMEIAKTYKYDLPATNKQPEVRHLFSSNRFLFGTGSKNKITVNGQTVDVKWDAVTGIKTGYTNAAQQCIITSATKDGRNLVSVVLKASGMNLYSDSRTLLEYGFNNFKSFTFAPSGQLIKTIELDGEKKSKIDLYTNKEVKALIPLAADETTITSEVIPNSDIKLPVTTGQVLGKLKLSYQGQTLSETDLVTMGAISDKATLGSNTTKYIHWLPIDQSPKGLAILGAKILGAIILWRLLMKKLTGGKKRKKRKKHPQGQKPPAPREGQRPMPPRGQRTAAQNQQPTYGQMPPQRPQFQQPQRPSSTSPNPSSRPPNTTVKRSERT